MFGLSPLTTVDTEVGVEPAPASAVDVEEPSDVVVPYWKEKVVAPPFGLMVPLSVTVVVPVDPAEPVVTAGADVAPVLAPVLDPPPEPPTFDPLAAAVDDEAGQPSAWSEASADWAVRRLD